jgi:glycosyltransferase involved in cell wall biosynthesis
LKDPDEQVAVRILLVSTSDQGGGAERSAWSLFKAYAAQGHKSWLAVGYKRSDDPDLILIPNESSTSRWTKMWDGMGMRLEQKAPGSRGFYRMASLARLLSNPRRWTDVRRGYENFHFPGTWRLLDLVDRPQIVHCFNLHGDYFDLRALSSISRKVPVVLDLRDAWLLSGHCAHSFDCDRWRTGCGNCPDLTLYPAIGRDGTAANWRRKREIYAASRIYISTPSQWLMRKVEQSMLAPAIVQARVIPTGVDLTIYHPGDKAAARRALHLPQDAKILLFAANQIRRNIWKDYNTVELAIASVGKRYGAGNIHLVALGENGPAGKVGETQVHFVPHQADPETVALYYQAADIYVHAARADTFPRVVLEALACGIPVLATAVGGIPEQIKPLQGPKSITPRSYTAQEATGILTQPGDPEEMAFGMDRLLRNDSLRHQLSRNARADAVRRFDLQVQATRYIEWYRAILEESRGAKVEKIARRSM